jgi:hypothetical protein
MSAMAASGSLWSSGVGLTLGGSWGGTQIWAVAGTVNFDSVTAGTGSTVLLGTANGGTIQFNSTTVNGLLLPGRALMVQGGAYDWATNSGANTPTGSYSGYTLLNGTNSIAGGTLLNYLLTGNGSIAAAGSLNTLKIVTASTAGSLVLTGSVSVNSGGVIVSGTADYALTGGTLSGYGATNAELLIHQFSSGSLTLNSVSAASSLTKAGPGLLRVTMASKAATTYFLGGVLETSTIVNLGSFFSFSGGTLRFTSSTGSATRTFNFGDI